MHFRLLAAFGACLLGLSVLHAQSRAGTLKLDPDAEKWVAATLRKMSLEDKVGQLLVSSFGSEYLSTDSSEYDALVKSVHEYRIGGFFLFGGARENPPRVFPAHPPQRAPGPPPGPGAPPPPPAG